MTRPSKTLTRRLTKRQGSNPVTSKSTQMLFTRDTSITFPELWLHVYVSGPPGDAQGFPEMFARARCFKASTPDDADLVVFTGGPDVNPEYYTKQKAHDSVFVDEARDEADLALYAKCYDEGIPMFGVCRGAQFGHVMNGGQLFMDIDNHQSKHLIYTLDNQSVMASSVHHQSCIQNYDMDMIAWTYKSGKRWLSASSVEEGSYCKDVEAFFYDETCFLGVQGHPEYKGYFAYTNWCLTQIQELIVNNPNIVLDKEKGVYRLKKSFIQLRDDLPAEELKETA